MTKNPQDATASVPENVNYYFIASTLRQCYNESPDYNKKVLSYFKGEEFCIMLFILSWMFPVILVILALMGDSGGIGGIAAIPENMFIV